MSGSGIDRDFRVMPDGGDAAVGDRIDVIRNGKELNARFPGGSGGGATGATGATGSTGATGATGATGEAGGGLTVHPAVIGHAGGGQSGATQLAVGVSPLTPAASPSDSAQLPPAVAGAIVLLVPMYVDVNITTQVFVKDGSSDTMNGGANVADVTNINGAGIPIWFVCPTDGAWFTNAELD